MDISSKQCWYMYIIFYQNSRSAQGDRNFGMNEQEKNDHKDGEDDKVSE